MTVGVGTRRSHTHYCDDFQQHVDREVCQDLADSIDLDTALKNHNNHYQTGSPKAYIVF
jgi:hypothetical protein